MQEVLIDNINYELDPTNRTAAVCPLGYSEYYSGDIVIPPIVFYEDVLFSVTSIGYSAFNGCTGLASIIIPNSVTSIGFGAFCGCTGLTSIIIPNSVTNIGFGAFCGCTGLTSITIPNSVTSIGDNAFYGCTGLISITIPNSVTSIGYGAFCDCIDLTSITIPNSVTSIGYSAFKGCKNLTSITIPGSVTSIGNSVFWGCKSLISITIPNSVTAIENSVFEGCSGLTSITLPHSVTSIGDSAFFGCKSLAFITIPNSVITLGEGAFRKCTGLTSITIPNSVENIGKSVFWECKRLTSIVIECGNKKYDSRNNCNAIIETVTNMLIAGCPTTIIPNNITSIGEYAFWSCSNLAFITIPNGITSIGRKAFYGCNSLSSITIPDSVTIIGNGAFEGCCNLTSIILPNSITNIGEFAFLDCTKLASITIPDNVTRIESCIFSGCISLTSITIPDGVTSIENGAFGGCTSLTSITISDSVTSIGNGAFYGCTSLISITIPNSVTEIIGNNDYDCPFRGCDSLSTIRIPQGKLSVFSKAALEDLQDKIVEYTEAVIGGVLYQLDHKYEDNQSQYQNDKSQTENNPSDNDFTAVVCANKEPYTGDIVVPAQVKYEGKTYTVNRLGERAFADCYELTAVTLPKSITEIGEDVFFGCENLQTIRVPQGMTDKFCQMGLEPWRDKIVEPRQEEYTILLNIARGYELGIGMARNLAQAVLCYVQAADKGCAEAAYHLGELYAEGKGLPQDYQQAADWFGKAAALYHPNGTARQQECLRIIEQEAARLAAFEQEQQAERQAQLARITAAPKSQKTILFFDTETNGLPRNYKADITNTFNWPRLIQLGWLITDEEGNILKRKSQLIYPHFTIDADVIRLTGITTAQAQREGVDLAQVLREFAADATGASLIVGHNIDFDLHVVGCELYREGMDYRALLNQPTVCTMQRSTDFCAIPSTNSYYSGYKYPTLTELYTKLFEHTFSGAHDALTDITATKDCYFELRKRGII